MKKRNGFTLIELLAIIVILAIIAVITVPIILNIIETARKGAAKNSVTGYGKAVELAFTQYQYKKELDGVDNSTDFSADGKTKIQVTVKDNESDTSEEKVNLVVNYEGDDVVCNASSADDTSVKEPVGTINAGKLVLDKCYVEGGYGPFKYEKGVASDSEGE